MRAQDKYFIIFTVLLNMGMCRLFATIFEPMISTRLGSSLRSAFTALSNQLVPVIMVLGYRFHSSAHKQPWPQDTFSDDLKFHFQSLIKYLVLQNLSRECFFSPRSPALK